MAVSNDHNADKSFNGFSGWLSSPLLMVYEWTGNNFGNTQWCDEYRYVCTMVMNIDEYEWLCGL